MPSPLGPGGAAGTAAPSPGSLSVAGHTGNTKETA
jgi:hypothetical protein